MKKLIFLVEDDKDVRETLAFYLELEGFQVVQAVNGQDALDQLKAMKDLPAVIILDLMMPVKSGVEFRADQVKDARLASVPVIVVSAAPSETEIRTGLQGVRRILSKPIDMETLISDITRYAS